MLRARGCADVADVAARNRVMRFSHLYYAPVSGGEVTEPMSAASTHPPPAITGAIWGALSAHAPIFVRPTAGMMEQSVCDVPEPVMPAS